MAPREHPSFTSRLHARDVALPPPLDDDRAGPEALIRIGDVLDEPGGLP